MLLGVNIDHIAVLREARAINDPNPLDALGICKLNGADQITIHLREDRRHIHDEDLRKVMDISQLPVNLECSINEEMVKIACHHKPHRVTLVPENREEVTTEGGLDLEKNFEQIKKVIKQLQENSIEVSLFIDPCEKMIKLSKDLNAQWIELHTGSYANIYAMLFSGLDKTHHSIKEMELPRQQLQKKLKNALKDIKKTAKYADSLGLKVAAGHGLNYQNVTAVKDIKSIKELNIGQSIVARSVFTGLSKAITDMRELIS
jgi:pyridoxine 5-phosphate synthase